MKSSSPDFRRRKCAMVLGLLGLGLTVGVFWDAMEALALGKGYPEAYLLGMPDGRFGDFTDLTQAAALPNPYADPFSCYTPAAYAFFRWMTCAVSFSLILIDFLSVAALALLLARLLRPIAPHPWHRVALAFLLLALSYPVLFCLDRGNIEIILAPLIAWALYFWSRGRDRAFCVCLLPAICLKMFPALFLVLLLRRGRLGLALLCAAAAAAVIGVSFLLFPVSPGTLWTGYIRNLGFFRDFDLLNNGTLEGAASLWNVYKIGLLALYRLHLLPIVNFGFDGPFILASYRVYTLLSAIGLLACLAYAWLLERQAVRGILVLLLMLSILAPTGADYRLMYAVMALVLLMLLPRRRSGDGAALVLVALAVLPKKELLLTFVGGTETGYADVPVQSVLDPLLILAALAVLLVQARRFFNRRHAVPCLRKLLPLRWRRS